MKLLFRKYQTWLFFLFLSIALVWPASNIYWSEKNYEVLLGSDARGYYAHLPAAFIYQDLNFAFFDSLDADVKYNPNLYYDYRFVTTNGTVNKYFVGTSLLQLPFFTLGHIWASLGSYATDGYSMPYLISLSIGGIIYALLGCWFFFQIGQKLQLRFRNLVLSIVFMLLGTNLFFYTLTEPGMSHVYSFFLISLFAYLILKPNAFGTINLLGLGILLGLITLVRPVNAMVIFAIPFLWQVRLDIQTLRFSWKKLSWVLIPLFLIISIQPILYFFQTGNFWVYSYGNQGFDFLNPHFFSFLFSFKKGLFVYTPMLLLCVFLLFLSRLSHRSKIYWGAFFVGVVFVLSSWEIWWYGGSFGQRAMIEYYGILFLPFAIGLEHISSRLKTIVISVALMVLLLNQFQTYQYRYHIIHWEDMNRERYIDRFWELPE